MNTHLAHTKKKEIKNSKEYKLNIIKAQKKRLKTWKRVEKCMVWIERSSEVKIVCIHNNSDSFVSALQTVQFTQNLLQISMKMLNIEWITNFGGNQMEGHDNNQKKKKKESPDAACVLRWLLPIYEERQLRVIRR